MQDQQPQGFFNRGIIGLLMVFTIPALLTAGAMFIVILIGYIPGGKDTVCEQALNEYHSVRLSVYAYQAGLSLFQKQTISVSDGNTWQDLSTDDVQWPKGISCETNILELGTDAYLLHDEKTLALSDDGGETWQVANICDLPHPSTESCDDNPLNFSDISFAADASGTVSIVQNVTDDYGQPQYDNGVLLIAVEWSVTTNDAGRTWTLESSD